MGDVELKTTTHYRDRVSTFGSAAYGNGRIDNKNEKKREIKKLDYTNYLFHAIKPPRIQQAKISSSIEKMISQVEKNMELMRIRAWQEQILSITPRYIYESYDAEKDVIKVEYLGALQNVMKYYSETSVIEIRNEVEKSIEKIREKRLLSENPFVIEISRSQYQDFVKYELKNLKSKIETNLNEAEIEQIEEKTGTSK